MDPQFALERYKQLHTQIDQHANSLTEIARITGDNLEGNCFTNHNTVDRNEQLLSKRINLLEIARHGNKILELGFNAGHSALLLLLGCKPEAEITFLDIGGHPYVRPCFEYLNKVSPVKKELILANSLQHLPKIVLKDGQRDIYDIIHMDGGHSQECVVNDLILLFLLLKKGGYMVVDDADGFILEEVSLFVSLGLFEVVPGQYKTEHYPHIIVQKV
jgi:predicted O-methyltransferase YrrM